MVFGKHFSKYYLRYLWAFLIGAAILIAIDWIQLQIPEYIGSITSIFYPKDAPDDYRIGTGELSIIHDLILKILYTSLIIAIGRFLWRFAIFGTSRQIEFEIRRVMFLHATRLPQSFYSHKKVGGLMTHFINDLNAVREAFGPGLLSLIDGIFLGGFSLYRMFLLNYEITIVVIIPIVALIVVVAIVNKSMRMRFRVRQDSFEKMSDFTQESFSGISVIKAYVRELRELMTFKQKSADFYEKNIKYVRQMTIMQIVVSVIANVIILVIIALSGYLLISTVSIFGGENSFEAGHLVTYQAYFMQLMWPISAITRFFYITSQAKASSKRIEEFLNSPIEVKDREGALNIADLKGNIRVNNLTFTYPDGEVPALKNISFTINEGENVGILGKTGSGKSTFVDLLMRTYNFEDQSIFIGDNDLMNINVHSVRGAIGYVPQDNFLFSDTIANNIDFSHENVDMERVKKAAMLADVDGNISEFPEQYNTVLGERGVTVSGGQKQRISIARALCKDPNILILDDSVSAVDTKTEEAIISNLHQIRKGKTTIFIAHRISTVKNMDKIILFDEGRVIAVGSHDELLHISPVYKDMVRRQQLENIVRGDHHERF